MIATANDLLPYGLTALANDLFIIFIIIHTQRQQQQMDVFLTLGAAVVRYQLAKAVMNQQLCNRRHSRILRMVTVHLPCNLSKKEKKRKEKVWTRRNETKPMYKHRTWQHDLCFRPFEFFFFLKWNDLRSVIQRIY